MTHSYSIFTNSCVKVPVDRVTKMPKTAYERKENDSIENKSIDSPSTVCSDSVADFNSVKLKDFYRSIPDYKDINHLTAEEFYFTLKSLRDKKRLMFIDANEYIRDSNGRNENKVECYADSILSKSMKSKLHNNLRRNTKTQETRKKRNTDGKMPLAKISVSSGSEKNYDKHLKKSPEKQVTTFTQQKPVIKVEGPKRNQSACSITWNDNAIDNKYEVDEKFSNFFSKCYEFKTQSMPSSPMRSKPGSPIRKHKSFTVPKPFKMTQRDEEERMVNELRSLRKSFSEDALDQKYKRKHFKANPVPIESRIPLYDKILEDQAMRRAITKINSEAELRAQMKPFSFTRREQEGTGICERATQIIPKPKKKKRFRARPVPKNLFSNYFYDKMKEEEFFRNVNRRIRAEELLRSANLPGTMAAREHSRLSTPAAHSDLPIDPSPSAAELSTISSDRQRLRSKSPVKSQRKREKVLKEEFVTTSPQPFKFSTAERAAKKMQEVARQLNQEIKSTQSIENSIGGAARVYSALELRVPASGRSNLAALLRAEAVRRKFEMEAASRLEERRRKTDMKQRDRLLRSNPAWYLVKNNHEEDIAMRLQTRRDEERMRREEFLHEMELMYGRVQQQPMLFERYYAPRSDVSPVDFIQLSPRKHTGKKKISKKTYNYSSPNRSQKADVNETYNGHVLEYLNGVNSEDKLYSDSEVAIDSLDEVK